jgi:hypothetical protein
MRFRGALLVALVCSPVLSASAQTRAEVIRGQVKTDGGVDRNNSRKSAVLGSEQRRFASAQRRTGLGGERGRGS